MLLLQPLPRGGLAAQQQLVGSNAHQPAALFRVDDAPEATKSPDNLRALIARPRQPKLGIEDSVLSIVACHRPQSDNHEGQSTLPGCAEGLGLKRCDSRHLGML